MRDWVIDIWRSEVSAALSTPPPYDRKRKRKADASALRAAKRRSQAPERGALRVISANMNRPPRTPSMRDKAKRPREDNEEDDELGDNTPVQNLPQRPAQAQLYSQAVGDTSAAGFMASVRLPPAQSVGSSSRQRSNSPVKGMGDLRFAAKPIKLRNVQRMKDLPADVQELCLGIKNIRDGQAVVHQSMYERVASKIADDDLAPPLSASSIAASGDGRAPATEERGSLLLADLERIVEQTRRALVEPFSEAHWNERVHSRILEAALECGDWPAPGDKVGFFNTTSATLARACVPPHSGGLNLQAKVIDYCLVLQDEEIQEVSRRAVSIQMQSVVDNDDVSVKSSSTAASDASESRSRNKRQRTTGNSQSSTTLPQSINHTEYTPLRLTPIFASIETKKPGDFEDGGKAQLSVWASGHIIRLHQLLGTNVSQPVAITLPLLYVAGPEWHVFFAREGADSIDLWQFMKIDGTDSWLGCFKVLALLRALGDWGIDTYRPWFMRSLGDNLGG